MRDTPPAFGRRSKPAEAEIQVMRAPAMPSRWPVRWGLSLAAIGLMGLGVVLWMGPPPSATPQAVTPPTADEPAVTLDLTPLRAFPDTTIVWYDVPGTDTRAIHDYMQTHGSIDGHDGTVGEGWTKWRMNWRYPVSPAGCDTSQVQVSFSGEVTLPHFVDLARMDAAHQAGWTRYLNALVIHEAGHIGHAYQHVDDVAAAVRGKNCADAGPAAQAMIDQLGQYDAEYDRQTHHGGAQGVIYPN